MLKSKKMYEKSFESLKKEFGDEDYNALLNALEEKDKTKIETLIKKHMPFNNNYNDFINEIETVEKSDEFIMDFQVKMLQLMQIDMNREEDLSDEDIINDLKVYKNYFDRTLISFQNLDLEHSTPEIYLEQKKTVDALFSRLENREVKFGDYQFGKNEELDRKIFDEFFYNQDVDILTVQTIQVEETQPSFDYVNKIDNVLQLSEEEKEDYNQVLTDGEKEHNSKKINFISFKDSEGRIIDFEILVDGEKIENIESTDLEKQYTGVYSEFLRYIEEQELNLNDKKDILNFLILAQKIYSVENLDGNYGEYNVYIELMSKYKEEIFQNVKYKNINFKYSDFNPDYPDIDIYKEHMEEVVNKYLYGSLTEYCENLTSEFEKKLEYVEKTIEDGEKLIKDFSIMKKHEYKKDLEQRLEKDKNERDVEMLEHYLNGEMSDEEFSQAQQRFNDYIEATEEKLNDIDKYYKIYFEEQNKALQFLNEQIEQLTEEKEYLKESIKYLKEIDNSENVSDNSNQVKTVQDGNMIINDNAVKGVHTRIIEIVADLSPTSVKFCRNKKYDAKDEPTN